MLKDKKIMIIFLVKSSPFHRLSQSQGRFESPWFEMAAAFESRQNRVKENTFFAHLKIFDNRKNRKFWLKYLGQQL